jgi:tetratricopeptide (TPR) repeat protein
VNAVKDLCDGEITLADASALEDWNGVILGFLAHAAATPDHLNALLAKDATCPMALAIKGFSLLMLARRELVPVAQEAHRDAVAAAKDRDLSARESAWIEALGQWLDGQPSRSIETIETILQANPRDSLTAKLSHGIRFILGDSAGMRRSIERVLPAHAEDHPLHGYLLGCHAFALEETGAYAQAEAAGLKGLSLVDDDAWGLHAVAHVYDMTADSARGLDLLNANEPAWARCNNFRYHVWWHKALMHLDQGQPEEAFALYDQKVRIDRTDDYRDIANATSLLMRLELEGHAVGHRWEEIAELAANRTDDGCLVFADLHYMLALAGDQKTQAREQMITRMQNTQIATQQDAITVDPGQAAARGLSAFGEGRYDAAFRHLMAARPRMPLIGGSHAQRDVFERITVDAGLRAGYGAQVREVLNDRCKLRGGKQDSFARSRYAQLTELTKIPAQ